jgi:large conductance mechanosensitive channel
MNISDFKNTAPIGAVRGQVTGFVDFIREQGVMGLAIGFILGGAVSKTVTSLVENVINPLIGILLGKVNLVDRAWTVGKATLKYGAFISSVIDFIIIAAVGYISFKLLKLDRLDKKKTYKPADPSLAPQGLFRVLTWCPSAL